MPKRITLYCIDDSYDGKYREMSRATKYIPKGSGQVIIDNFTDIMIYPFEFFDAFATNPNEKFPDCGRVLLLDMDTEEILCDALIDQKKEKYKIVYVKEGFDVDNYYWMDCLTRPPRGHMYKRPDPYNQPYRAYLDMAYEYDYAYEHFLKD